MVSARSLCALWVLGLSLALATLGLSGCHPVEPLQAAGVSIVLPDAWRARSPCPWQVPGTPLAAWSGPDGSSLVIYQGLPIPGGGSAERMAEALVNQLTNLPELTVVERRIDTVAGQPVARIEVVAPGTGASLAPSGAGKPIAVDGKPLVPTRQCTLGFPRRAGPVYLTWHAPEAASARVTPAVEAALGSLKFAAETTSSSSSY